MKAILITLAIALATVTPSAARDLTPAERNYALCSFRDPGCNWQMLKRDYGHCGPIPFSQSARFRCAMMPERKTR